MYTLERSYSKDGLYNAHYCPEGDLKGSAVLLMPFGIERGHTGRTVHEIAIALTESGWESFVYDYPGMGESRGETADCTLAASIQAGCALLADKKAKSVLAVRSGSLVGAPIAEATEADLILLQPYLDGNAFLRDLQLKERIRGEIISGEDSREYRLNGSIISKDFQAELEAADISDMISENTCIIQTGSGSKALPRYSQTGARVVLAQGPPFWNPHEHWDVSELVAAVVEEVVKL